MSIFFIDIACQESKNFSTKSSYEGINYKILWQEDLPAPIRAKMEEVSLLILHQSRLPGSLGGLVKRAKKDLILFEKVLKFFGYYGGSISLKINTEQRPVEISFQIDLGGLYTLKKVVLQNAQETISLLEYPVEDIVRLNLESSITTEQAINAKVLLKKYFSQKGYPFVEVEDPIADIDHNTKAITLTYPVILGGKGTIKDSIIEQTKTIDPEFIRNRLFWCKDSVYDLRVVERTKRYLTQTGVFSHVNIAPEPVHTSESRPNLSKENPETKPIIMKVKVTEAPPRAITAGLHYATSQGNEARASWDHYNLLGHGENIGVNGRISQVRSKLRLHYDIPDCLSPRQTWRNETFIIKENTRAYKGFTHEIQTELQRQLTEEFSGSIGLSSETGYIRPKTTNTKTTIRLFSIPTEARLDTSNDLLNPTQGLRVNAGITPYTGTLGSSKGMMIIKAGASIYFPFATNTLDEDDGTLAAFAKLGVIRIRHFNELPPNKRFYGGGNGSIRGYGYQLVGPVDQNRIPLGGQSFFEGGTELRYRFTETIGGVIFLETGNVWSKKIPSFKQDLLWGTGFGFRYYTDYAPIRVDIAFPLKRRKLPGARKSYDAPYQFYVSVGQAF